MIVQGYNIKSTPRTWFTWQESLCKFDRKGKTENQLSENSARKPYQQYGSENHGSITHNNEQTDGILHNT